MDRPCKSSWTEAHEIFQAEEYDAGASPTHQASQRGGGRQLGEPGRILKILWKLLRKSLMKPFMKAHVYIVNGP